MARIRSYENSNSRHVYSYYQPYTPGLWGGYGWNGLWSGGLGWSGYGWGALGWNPLFCDPFSLTLFSNNPAFLANYYACFDPLARLFVYNPFLFNLGLGPFSYSSLYSGGPLSPLYYGANCLLCTSSSGLPGSYLGDPYMTPLQSSSVTISNGALPGLLPAPATSSPSLATPAGVPSTYTYATPAATNQPVTLVLTNGTQVEATQYQLAADGSLHYVTVAGKPETIPFGQLDMKATMKANQDKGVDFLVPKPQEPKPQGK